MISPQFLSLLPIGVPAGNGLGPLPPLFSNGRPLGPMLPPGARPLGASGPGFALPPGVGPFFDSGQLPQSAQMPDFGAAAMDAIGKNYGSVLGNVRDMLQPGQPPNLYDPRAMPFGPGGIPLGLSPLAQRALLLRQSAIAQARLGGQDAIDQAQAQQAGNNASLSAMDALPIPQRNFTPFTPQPLPTHNLPAFPNRPRPQLDPLTGIASGIMGLIAPAGAGQFTRDALQGAVGKAQQDYGDRLQQFNVATQQANTQYEDALNQTNLTNTTGLANLRGGEAADYANAITQRQAGEERLPLLAQRASLESALGTPGTPGSLSRRADTMQGIASDQADLSNADQNISMGLSSNATKIEMWRQQQENALKRAGVYTDVAKGMLSAQAAALNADASRRLQLYLQQQRLDQQGVYQQNQFTHADQAQQTQIDATKAEGALNRTAYGKKSADEGNGPALVDSDTLEKLRQTMSQTDSHRQAFIKEMAAKGINWQTDPVRMAGYNQMRSASEQAVTNYQAAAGIPRAQRTFPQYETQWDKAQPTGATGGTKGKLTDPSVAYQYLQRAGGDKAKARQLAQQEGWSF
jgi:hypothetical protein